MSSGHTPSCSCPDCGYEATHSVKIFAPLKENDYAETCVGEYGGTEEDIHNILNKMIKARYARFAKREAKLCRSPKNAKKYDRDFMFDVQPALKTLIHDINKNDENSVDAFVNLGALLLHGIDFGGMPNPTMKRCDLKAGTEIWMSFHRRD